MYGSINNRQGSESTCSSVQRVNFRLIDSRNPSRCLIGRDCIKESLDSVQVNVLSVRMPVLFGSVCLFLPRDGAREQLLLARSVGPIGRSRVECLEHPSTPPISHGTHRAPATSRPTTRFSLRIAAAPPPTAPSSLTASQRTALRTLTATHGPRLAGSNPRLVHRGDMTHCAAG